MGLPLYRTPNPLFFQLRWCHPSTHMYVYMQIQVFSHLLEFTPMLSPYSENWLFRIAFWKCISHIYVLNSRMQLHVWQPNVFNICKYKAYYLLWWFFVCFLCTPPNMKVESATPVQIQTLKPVLSIRGCSYRTLDRTFFSQKKCPLNSIKNFQITSKHGTSHSPSSSP